MIRLRSSVIAAAIAFTAPAAALDLSPADIDALGRITFAEAGHEPSAGKAAVIAVVLNRASASGKSVQEVINAKNQFEPVAGRTWRSLPALTPVQQAQFMVLLDLSVSGYMRDPTNGATHFQNPDIVAQRARAGKVRPSLVHFGGMPQTAAIGNHVFYSAEGRRDEARVAASPLPTMFLGVPTSETGETVFLVAPTQ